MGSYAGLSFSENTWLSLDRNGTRRSESWRHEIAETVWFGFGRPADWGRRQMGVISMSFEMDIDTWQVTNLVSDWLE
jgi:hypothetical protein